MVSFIVPVYQAVKTLDACVAGILSQTNTDFELILVDDGSTDGSGQLCDSYTDRRVRVLHGMNAGAAAARNRGIAAASGEWRKRFIFSAAWGRRKPPPCCAFSLFRYKLLKFS